MPLGKRRHSLLIHQYQVHFDGSVVVREWDMVCFQHHGYLPKALLVSLEAKQGWPGPSLDLRPDGAGRGVGGPVGASHLPSDLLYLQCPRTEMGLNPVQEPHLSFEMSNELSWNVLTPCGHLRSHGTRCKSQGANLGFLDKFPTWLLHQHGHLTLPWSLSW